MIALEVCRDGALPAGSEEAAEEAAGRVLVVGSGTADAAGLLRGRCHELSVFEAGPFAPGTWAATLAPVLADEDVVVLPASPDGRDLAPRLALALGRPLLAPALAVTPRGATVIRGGGLVLEDVEPDGAFVATLQPGSRGIGAPHRPEVDATAIAPEPIRMADPELVEVRGPDPTLIELAEAKRIVAGGAGLGSAEAMAELAGVASALGCALGATRVVTDAGWVDVERQIGTTGAVVDPDLYVAFGISGAVQHVSGLGNPGVVVAVNLDASAPMMSLADLAIVTDAPALVRALAVRLGSGPTEGDGGA